MLGSLSIGESMEGKPSISHAARIREWAQFGILLFATAWGVYTYILKDILGPAQRPTALELTTTLEEVGQAKGYRLIRIRIVSTNPSDRRTYIPALWYTVWGQKLANADSRKFWGTVNSALPGKLTARHSRDILGEVVASRRIYVDNTSLYDPHEKTTEEDVFAVPTRLYDYLIMKVEYRFARDTVGMGQVSWQLDPDGSWVPSFPDAKIDLLRTELAYNWSVATLSMWPRTQSP